MKSLITLAIVISAFAGQVLAKQDIDIKVVGIASLSDGNGTAIISVNGQPERSVSTGDFITSELKLYKVFENKVVVQNKGVTQVYQLTAGEPYLPPEPALNINDPGQNRKLTGVISERVSDVETLQDASALELTSYSLEPGQNRQLLGIIPEQSGNIDEPEIIAVTEYDRGQSRTMLAPPVDVISYSQEPEIRE